MALANKTVPFCSFHWDIHHPFMTRRMLMARFYHASPIFTQWKVMIEHIKRRINWWTFNLHLQIEKNFDGRRDITADRVQVGIFLGDRCIHEQDVANVSFRPYDFTYTFKVNAIAKVLQDQELLVVKIILDIPVEPVQINRYTFDDSKWLSEDLLQLHDNPVHSDLRLCLNDNDSFPVHACIFQARWNNFLILHQPNVDGEIKVNMSRGVLKDILMYLYSCKVHSGWPNNDVNYITELFDVINRYQMNHLYRVLRLRNMQQRRFSEKDTITVPLVFPLWELVDGQFVGSTKRWCVNKNTPYECTFTIYVQTYCSSPWLSYSLRSSSGICIYAQVNLDIRKRIVETHENFEEAYYQITHVHQDDYTIQPNKCKESKNTLFLGCPETFEYFYPLKSSAQIIEGSHSMLCTLKFTDGRILNQIQSTVDDLDAEADEMNRLHLLGDHLFRLFASQVESDLMINAPTENENQPDEIYYIHRAIFAARVPLWRRVIRDYQEPGDMPRETRLLLRSEALPFVLSYIYSSRSHSVSPDLFDEIQNFANIGASHSLHNRIICIRNEQDIDDWDSE